MLDRDVLSSIVTTIAHDHLGVLTEAEPDLALGSGIHRGSWRVMWHDGPDNWPTMAFGPNRIDVSGFFALQNVPPGTLFAEPISSDVLGLYPA